MPKIHRSALVMHSAKAMFDLVNDVKAYPQFIPDCRASKVVSASTLEMVASLQIGKGGINKWFTTKNLLKEGQAVEMQLIDGPFKRLIGIWRFDELDADACKVSLDLEFEFSNKLVELAFGKIFNHVANSMVKSFTERAKVVYCG